jgi:NADH-quinone oxidoreductase subunit M
MSAAVQPHHAPAPGSPPVGAPVDPAHGSVRFHTRELIWLLAAVVAVGGTAALEPTLAPAVVAAVVAALVPRRHAPITRVVFAFMAALFALFVVRNWPQVGEVPEGLPPVESPTLLSWLIGLPMAGAAAVLFLPRQTPGVLRWTTLLVMFGTLAASLLLLQVPMGREYHYNQDVVWLPRFGIHYHVALDGISLWLVLLTTLIVPIAAWVSFGPVTTRLKDWCFALLLLEGALIGALVSLDLFVFYIFWELMLIPMYVMIGVWGGTNRIKAAIKFFLYTFFGSILMLGAMLYLAYTYGRATGGTMSFDYFELQRLLLPRHVQTWLFAAFALAFLIKVPMWPLHTWLPDAHTEAPTAGSIILAAVMLKMGTYGYLRFCLGLFPEASAEWAANLAGVAVLGGILYGALCAWRQGDVKRLVAYSSVAHLGYVMLGIFATTPSSLEGSMLQMVNHGISTGALFLLVGVIYDRRHTRELDEFGGLAKVMPVYAALFVVVTLSSIGVPGTNGFVGEFMIITGTFISNKLGHFNGVQAVGAALGVILGAIYMLGAVQKMFFGPITKPENKTLHDINRREILGVAPLIVLIFVIGLFPNIFLSRVKDACQRIQGDLESRIADHPPPAFYSGPIRLFPRRPEATPPPDTPPGSGESAPGTKN